MKLKYPAGSPTPRNSYLIRAFATVLGAAGLALGLSVPAHATAYRYWSYWQGASGEWVMSDTGPAAHKIVDRDVQGWRFEISTESASATPDNSADFATLCPALAASAAPADGSARVAVVVDSGFLADAPSDQKPPADQIACVTLAKGSTGNQALAAAGAVRTQSSMVCAINAYPATGCGDQVGDSAAAAAASAAATESPNPAVPAAAAAQQQPAKGSPLALIVSLAAILAVALAALSVNRRRARAAVADPALPDEGQRQ